MNTQTSVVSFQGMSGVALTNKKGATVGVRLALGNGGLTASEVRAALKCEGIKGRELTRKVNEVLTGDKDMRWAKHEAAISVIRSNGGVPDVIDNRKGGATAKFFYPKSPVAGITKNDALEALGITEADLIEFRKQINAKKA